MMKRGLLFGLILGLLLGHRALAQQEQYRWRVGAYLGSMSYYGDLNQRLLPETVNPDHPAFGFSVERLFNKAWSAKLLYTQGQWIANDRRRNAFLARSLNAKTEVQDYSLLFTYYLDNNRQLGRRSFLSPYVSFGLGYTNFSVYGDLRDGNGDYYHYWSDYSIRNVPEDDPNAAGASVVTQDGVYETELSPLATEREYPTESFSLPLALGLKFRLSSNINLNLELLMRYAFTDYLDDVSGDYRAEYSSAEQRRAANPTGQDVAQRGSSPNVNDFYAFPSLSLHYSFARRKTAYRAPKLYAVADRVDRFTPTLSGPVTVLDTIAALTVDPALNELETYSLSDSLRVVPHVVGQDTLLAIVQPVAESFSVLPEDSASLAATPPVFRDTVALINLATLPADSRAADTTGLSLIPLSVDQAIQARATDSGTELRLVEVEEAPTVGESPTLGFFNPLPDSAIFRPVEPAERSAEVPIVPIEEQPVPFSTLPPPSETAKSANPAVAARTGADTSAANVIPSPRRATTVPTKPIAEKKTSLKPSDSAAPIGQKADTSSVKTPPQAKPVVTPPGIGIAVVPPATSDADTASAQLDSSYVTALTARMDTFSGYLDEVSQRNDTSFTSILRELEQLKTQLNNLETTSQPAAQAASIEQRLRTLKLQELGTTEVYFGVGSSSVSTVGTERLQQVGVLVKNAPEATVRLRGFTDPTGNPERNQLLSQERAEAVRAILMEAGVPDDRISVAYFGADRTLARDQASYGRRVEVVVE